MENTAGMTWKALARLAPVALLGALAIPASRPSAGEDRTMPKSLELYPNFQTVSVYARFDGDDNGNGTTDLSFRRVGDRDWRKGHPLDLIHGKRWVGTLFWLTPDTEYEVRVRFADPDGAAPEELAGTVRTRNDRWPEGKGRTFYVSAARGNDAGDGSEGAPFKTIAKGVETLRPGDTLIVREGIYSEEVTIRNSGAPGAYIRIKGEKGAILDSRDPEFDPADGKDRWADEGEGLFRTALSKPTNYVSAEYKRLYGFETLDELKKLTSAKRNLAVKAIGGYWYDRQNRALYVKFCDGADPDTRKMQVATLGQAFLLEGAKYVIIEGFEIRTYSDGIRLRSGTSECVIRNNVIHNTDGGITMRGAGCHNNTFEDNDIGQYPSMAWGDWGLCKGTRYETSCIHPVGGRGTVIRRNRLHGSFNGITPSDWRRDLRTDWDPPMRDTDIHENELYDIGDDAIEPDGTGMNIRLWKNRCHSLFHPLSLAPISVGPCYVIRDVYWNYTGGSGGLKIRCLSDMATSAGRCYLYHLTVHTNLPDREAFRITSQTQWENFVIRNCIFRGVSGVFSDNTPAKRTLPVSLDGDCLFAAGGKSFVKFSGRRYAGIEEMRKDGHEKNGIQADPLFVDPDTPDRTKADFRLKPDSPCIDKAIPIPNINDDFDGKGPDIGAFEFSAKGR
ncbi:MAG: right-handed parallel beta-helix repeat-containing protein [Planctomycetota bacterium]|nr:right-handed parallel beta-helix repeat-containing protein [Planctomycetota bacterium]